MNTFKKAHDRAKKTRGDFGSYSDAFKEALIEIGANNAQRVRKNEDKEHYYKRIIRTFGNDEAEVTVKFWKVSDGLKRTIRGKFGVMEWYDMEGKYHYVIGTGKVNKHVKPIFDIDLLEYRSFRYNSIITIKINDRKFKYTWISKIKSYF